MPKRRGPKRGPRVGTILRRMSLTELRTALERRVQDETRKVRVLQRERASLEGRLTAVDRQIAELEDTIEMLRIRRRPGRPRKARAPGRPRKAGRRGPGRPRKARAARKTPRGRRGPRKQTFRDLAAEVLRSSGKPLHQRDIARLLRVKKGVKSRSKAFDRSLGLVLSKDRRFRRVARATYTLA